MKIVSSTQMKELDRKTIEEYNVPGEILMERAGTAVALAALAMLDKEHLSKSVLLFAGKGNNGGDALVAARFLEANGIKTVTVLLCAEDELQGDPKVNLEKLKKGGCAIITARTPEDIFTLSPTLEEIGIIVDGILGTGIQGTVRGISADAIAFIERVRKPVIAIDIPSGLSGDTGECCGPCLSADVTVTMGLPKAGLLKYPGLEYTGELRVVDIGIPEQLIKEVDSSHELVTEEFLHTLILPRKRLSHKGDYGHLLILAGSPGMTGAAALSGSAALRAGTGLVTVGIPRSLNPVMEVKLTEAMTLPLPETQAQSFSTDAIPVIEKEIERFDALLIGPGLSRHEETSRFVLELLSRIKLPVALDADGLNALQGKTDILKRITAPIILTPHPGEMARLSGVPAAEIQRDRWNAAHDFATTHEVVLVLKGAGTTIAAPDGKVAINSTGNPGMASGGTGDVLAGLIGSFLAQGHPPFDAAKAGVYIHGQAADLAAGELGVTGMIASDIIDRIPAVFKMFA